MSLWALLMFQQAKKYSLYIIKRNATVGLSILTRPLMGVCDVCGVGIGGLGQSYLCYQRGKGEATGFTQKSVHKNKTTKL